MTIQQRQEEIDKKHRIYLDEILKAMRHGDWKRVCIKTGLEQTYVSHSFRRVGSKHHLTVVQAALEVIEERMASYEAINQLM